MFPLKSDVIPFDYRSGLPLLKLFAPRWKRLAFLDSSDDKSNALYEYLHCVNAQPAR